MCHNSLRYYLFGATVFLCYLRLLPYDIRKFFSKLKRHIELDCLKSRPTLMFQVIVFCLTKQDIAIMSHCLGHVNISVSVVCFEGNVNISIR